jgi:hypothetical protein
MQHVFVINCWLFSLLFSKLHDLYNSCLVSNVTNPNSSEYKLTEIVLDRHLHECTISLRGYTTSLCPPPVIEGHILRHTSNRSCI